MILYMYIAPGQGQITSDDKISNLYRAFVTSIIFVQFHHDTPTGKETRGQKIFFVHWGQGQTPPMGQILESQEAIITLNICCKSQKDCFEL